ncbi:MAG: sensor histidine kinase [Gemmatimonadota bacterium]
MNGKGSSPPLWLRPIVRTDSLRAQILSGLAVLLFIALLVMASALLIWLPEGPSPRVLVLGLIGLVAIEVAVMVMFGGYLLRKQFVEPLERMVDEAEAIASGRQSPRLEEVGTSELRRLAASVNRMAERLLRNQELLAENVRSLDETNRALTEAQSELVRAEKLASVGRLAAGVAHEIGSPLGAILGYVELMERKGRVAEEWLGEIREEAARIDLLVRGLLDYARPKAAAIRAVSPREVVERALKLLEVQGKLKGVSVRTELDESTPRVRADPHQLEQVLVNLLLNARDAIESGESGGEIVVRAGPDRYVASSSLLAERSRRRDDPPGADFGHLRRLRAPHWYAEPPRLADGEPILRLEVLDDGVGLPDEEAERIFDPFYTTKAPGRGTGLGLAVSQRLVSGMGGLIRAEPRGEGGARFTVLLPAAETGATAEEGAEKGGT